MKRFFIALIAIFVGYQVLIHQLNDGFSPSKIDLVPKNLEVFESHPLLKQKFTYIGKGSQVFVFLGEDKTTVLKFFRANRYKIPKIMEISKPIFKNWVDKTRFKKEKKFENLLVSCRIASADLKKESAILTSHLSKSHGLPAITLIDRVHKEHTIDPNHHYFILQTKGVLLYPFLLECKEKNDLNRARNGIHKLISLIKKRDEKGIDDRDLVITKNIAFIDNEPVFIDIGEFFYTSNKRPTDWVRTFGQVEEWVGINFPDFLPYLKEELKKI